MSPSRRGAEDRVGDRVRDGVAVGVSVEVHVARNGNAAEDERSAAARSGASRSRSPVRSAGRSAMEQRHAVGGHAAATAGAMIE